MGEDRRHVYVIPTNRLCEESIANLAEEIIYAEQVFPAPLSMVVVDGSPEPIARRNRAAFNAVTEKFQRSDVYYFQTKQIDDLIKRVLRCMNLKEREKLQPLLTQEGVSYGIAANRTFLVAAMLQSDFLHRRDSDVYLQRGPAGGWLFPIEMEMEYLGKPVSMLPSVIPVPERFVGHERIYMVGGGYRGNWAVDFEDLAKADLESVYRLIHLVKPWSTYEEIRELVNRRFIEGSREEYARDEFMFPVDTFIEVGNFSIYKIFQQIPISPALLTSGTDYLYHALLNNVHLPMLYHNRRVVHRHTGDRQEEAWIFSYHSRLAMYRCVNKYYALLYKEISANREHYWNDDKGFLADRIGAYLLELSERNLQEEQMNVLESMVEIYNRSGIDKYVRLAEHLSKHRAMILQKSASDVRDHAFLTLAWPQLINFASEHGRELLAFVRER